MGSHDFQICYKTEEGLFSLPSGEKLPPPGEGAVPNRRVILYPFRTLSVQPFTLPFTHAAQVRDALKLRFRPLLGPDGGEILPSIVSRETRSCQGLAWVLSRGELDSLEEVLGSNGSVRVLPLPLAFAPSSGKGISIWADGTQVLGLAWTDGNPVAYRWWPRSRRSPQDAARDLALSADVEADEVRIIDFAEDRSGALAELTSGSRHLLTSPGAFRELDLSGRGIDTAVKADMVMGSFRRMTLVVLLFGAMAAALAGALFLEKSRFTSAIDARAEALYRKTFPGNGIVRDPLSQARARLRERKVGDATQDASLFEVLGVLGEAWADEQLQDVSLETLRFNPDGTDLTGTAGDVAEIDLLQQRFSGSGFISNLGDIQQIGSGRLRFTLSLEWRTP